MIFSHMEPDNHQHEKELSAIQPIRIQTNLLTHFLRIGLVSQFNLEALRNSDE